MAEHIEDAFVYDPRVHAFNVNAEVEYAMVTLTGTVDNLKAKRAAEQDARNTMGVVRVKNLIRVRPETAREDAEIAESIRKGIRRHAYLERFEITVTVRNAKAYLRGSVDSRFEKELAGDVAARVNGVAAVHNAIQVEYTPPESPDWEIAEDIRSQLFWSPFVDGDDVTVSVVDGVATLFGTVEDWRESQAAETNAVQGGAERVVNKLKVRNAPETMKR